MGSWDDEPTSRPAHGHSRADLLNVQSNVCNLLDAKLEVIASTFWMSQDAETRKDWIARQLAAGSTHTSVEVKYAYHGAAGAKDWIDDLRGWVRLLFELIDDRLIPDVFLTQGDGNWDDPDSETRQFCNPASRTYGPTLMAAIRTAAAAEGLPDPTGYCTWGYGFEPDARSARECLRVLRLAIGPKTTAADAVQHVMFFHLQQWYGTPGEGSNFWMEPIGREVDLFFFQAGGFRESDEPDEFGQLTWEDNAIEILNRHLPVNYPLPGCAGHRWRHKDESEPDESKWAIRTHPGVALGPDWHGGVSMDDRAALVFYEKVNYRFIRESTITVNGAKAPNPTMLAYVQTVAHRAKTLGFTRFGAGVPL